MMKHEMIGTVREVAAWIGRDFRGRGAVPHTPYVVVAAPPLNGVGERRHVVDLEGHLGPSICKRFESLLRIGPVKAAEAAD